MQTPAEQYMIEVLRAYLRQIPDGKPAKLLNVGSGKSTVIEKELLRGEKPFVCDRVDIVRHVIDEPFTGECFHCSVESMDMVQTDSYDAVFSNYVLEHVGDVSSAVRELYRVAKPGGMCVLTVPNPTAPECRLAKHTPFWFHKIFQGPDAVETVYAFNDIGMLTRLFTDAGFVARDAGYWSFALGYLHRFALLCPFGKLYDTIVNAVQLKRFMNNVCLVFSKPQTGKNISSYITT